MSEAYWQAKIWGLLHDPALKCLHNNSGRGGEGLWAKLEVMTGWRSPKESGKTILEWIAASDLIASASDRAAIGSLSTSINYAPSSDRNKGLEISHLLSGAKLENWRLPDSEHQQLVKQRDRANYLNEREKNLVTLLPTLIRSTEYSAGFPTSR